MFILAVLCVVFARHPEIYKVDLDDPPITRWTHIQSVYASQIKPFAETYASQISQAELTEIVLLLHNGFISAEMSQELIGLANTVNITYNTAAFLNFMYEWNAYCTSITVKLMNGTIIHGRNLDYDSNEFLANTTVEVHVYKSNKYLYTSIGFAWYLGVGTGISRYFSVSQNQRDNGGRVDTFNAINKGYQGDLWVLRKAFVNLETYQEASWYLNVSKVAASTYYIIAGLEEAAVIARNRDSVAGWMQINEENWYLVQTNSDAWMQDPDGRRTTAMKGLEAIGRENMTVEGLLNVLQTFPVLNPTTVFTSIMVPTSGYLYTTIY